MTQKQRNDAIIRKIEAYTAKFTATKEIAANTLRREGFNTDGWGGLT